jgi:hypothetical protein
MAQPSLRSTSLITIDQNASIAENTVDAGTFDYKMQFNVDLSALFNMNYI